MYFFEIDLYIINRKRIVKFEYDNEKINIKNVDNFDSEELILALDNNFYYPTKKLNSKTKKLKNLLDYDKILETI